MKDGKPCKHLERLLPRPDAGRSNLVYLANLKGYSTDAVKDLYPDTSDIRSEYRFRHFLRRFQLGEYETEFMVGKYVYNKTAAEMAKEKGMETRTVFYLLTKTLETLRSMGLKPADLRRK